MTDDRMTRRPFFKRLLSAVRHDVRFQFRHGFYYAYAFICAIYIALIWYIPESVRQEVTVLLVFSDPATLGFFFISGIVLLEQRQGILHYREVTPFGIGAYIIAKVISLMLLGVLAGLVIMLGTYGISFQVVPVLCGLMFSSIVFTLLGIIAASFAPTINTYLLLSPVYIVPFYLPVLDYVGLWGPGWMQLLPTGHGLTFINGAFQTLSVGQAFVSGTVLAVWSMLLFFVARETFVRNMTTEGRRTAHAHRMASRSS